MEDKRKQFLRRLAVSINKIARNEFDKKDKDMKPLIGELVDGYKGYIYDLGPGFLDFAEVYNRCIQIAKSNEIIGGARLKVRIKDFSSSLKNTDTKMLDDVFGMELVTATEREKEILMLFNHLIFQIQNDKKYNKRNGYVAYHCTGDFNVENVDVANAVNGIIENTETREYKYSKAEPQYDKDKMVKLFTNLSTIFSTPSEAKGIIQTLEEMIAVMKVAEIKRENVPIIEFHFLTSQVEQEMIRGPANHSKYKKTNEKLIKQFFNEGRLFRGINSPWKFVSNGSGLKLQDFYKTLLENWPFLKKDIVNKRKAGKEAREKDKNSRFDRLLASQFPFLRKYIEAEDEEYPEQFQAEKWGVLKGIMIANRINVNDKETRSLEDEFILEMENLWPSRGGK